MITTGMLQRQAWMADDDGFQYIVKNSHRVRRLMIDTKTIHTLKILQKGVMLCLYMEHTF